MSNPHPLTVGLVQRKPETAAKVVAQMEPSRAASILEVLPAALAASIFANMSTISAAAIVQGLQPTNAAAILSELNYQEMAAITRLVSDEARASLLEALPKKLSRDLRMTLNYPADTVGAKMNVLVVTVGASSSVAETLSELRKIKRSVSGVAFVVDETRRFLGAMHASDLLHLPQETPVAKVMDRSLTQIAARSRLTAVQTLRAWDDFTQLPVVDRRGRVVGALSRRAAVRARSNVDSISSDNENKETSVLAAIAGAFVASAVGVGELLLDIDGSESSGS